MSRWRSDTGNPEGIILVICVVVVAAIAVLGFFVFRAQARWEDWCESKGGHVDHETTWLPDGRGGVVSNTKYHCFTDSGEIGVRG